MSYQVLGWAEPSGSCFSQHCGFQFSCPDGSRFASVPWLLLLLFSLPLPSQGKIKLLFEPEQDKVPKASACELVGEEEERVKP